MKVYISIQPSKVDTKVARDLGCKYGLFNYWDIRTLKDERILETLTSVKDVMIDSGAFHLQHESKVVDFEKYLDGYIGFIKKWKDYINCYVELDVDNKVSLSRMESWHKRMSDEIGLDPIIVWHPQRGYKKWIEYCEKYDYVGYSGAVEQGIRVDMNVEVELMSWFFEIARKYNTKVHGFAFTKPKQIQKGMFYSVDSASYSTLRRYGSITSFEGGDLKVKQLKNRRLKGASVYVQTYLGMKPYVEFQKFAETKL